MGERDDNQRKAIMAIVASYIALALAILGLWLLVGCKPHREVVKEVTVIETKDSIHFAHDTLYFDVPRQTAQIVTHDSTSVLENDWAISHVAINKDGTLSHELESKPQAVPVPFEKPVEIKTQVIYKDKRVEVPVPVEKELTWWQKTLQWCGGIALALLALWGAAKWWLKGKGM